MDSTLDRARALARAALVACACVTALFVPPAGAQALLDETRAVATGIAPVEHSFTVTQAGRLRLTVTDLASPPALPALAAIRVAVTRGGTIIGQPLTAAGNVEFNAEAGATYAVRALGRPGTGAAAGSLGLRVTRVADPVAAPLLDRIELFEAPIPAPLAFANGDQGEVLVFAAPGTYTLSFADHGLPGALASGSAVLFLGANPAPVATVARGGPSATFTVPVASGAGAEQYRLFIDAAAAAALRAGLFGVRVVGGPGNTAVYDRSIPVGDLVATTEPFTNPAAGNLTLEVRDGAFPSPLVPVTPPSGPLLGAVLTQGGLRLATVTGAGTATAAAVPAGARLQLWSYARAGATAGTYEATVRTAATTLLASEARAVQGSAANAPPVYLYTFDAPAAGRYRARVTDFNFPSALSVLQFSVRQGGDSRVASAAGTLGGDLDFEAVSGRVSVFVSAQLPAAAAASGLFGVEVLTTGAAPTTLLERTQAVGATTDSRTLTVTQAGRYDVTLRDAGWPANFQNLAMAVTRGGQVIGRIFGGGTFFVDATPGSYLLTLVSTPSATEGAGLYSLAVRAAAPSVTLAANPSSTTGTQAVTLTWSSTATTGCTASGGAWSGTKATSGTESLTPAATTTYTLTCSGPGGSANASASVTVTPAAGGGGGGGRGGIGALGGLGLILLLGAPLLARRGAGAR